MAVFQALLAPVDGSEQSNAATELAIRIAEDQKAFVTFVTVVEVENELAKTSGSDLIMLGSHGRSGLERLILGSVAEGVVRKSQVPVLVAKLLPA